MEEDLCACVVVGRQRKNAKLARPWKATYLSGGKKAKNRKENTLDRRHGFAN